MSFFAYSVAFILGCFAAIHAACSLWTFFWRRFPVNENFRPTVAVILSVRGCDPTLRANLLGLIRQEYEPLQICIVVDHETDPAWNVVREIVNAHDHQRRCSITTLRLKAESCGLKCAAIAQAVGLLGDVDVVATIDADVEPPPNWLAQLIAPLADESVGATTGNHWFEPAESNLGSLVRSLWNAGALVPTAFFRNPWGGSLAMRLADIRSSGLIEAWLSSAVDDGPVRDACRKLGRRIVFLPGLIVVNRERCSLRFCFRYMTRILTWSRTYEPTFAWTAAHVVVNALPVVSALIVLPLTLLRKEWMASIALCTALVGHTLWMWVAYCWVRGGVDRMLRLRGERLPRLSLFRAAQLLLLVPLAMATYACAVLVAMRSRYVCWRGIWYYVIGARQVIRLNYQTYSMTPAASDEKASV